MISYYPTVPQSTNKIQIRLQIVKYAKEFSISAAAREFKTTPSGGSTRKSARKRKFRCRQLKRFDGSLKSLADRPRSPKTIPHKLSDAEEKKIVRLRRRFPRWGADRLRAQFELKFSNKTIYRVLHSTGLVKKRKRKYKRKRECAWKKTLMPFELMQMDAKDLSDIPEFFKAYKFLKLPRYQFTIRDVATGITFFGYSQDKSNFSASCFVEYVLFMVFF